MGDSELIEELLEALEQQSTEDVHRRIQNVSEGSEGRRRSIVFNLFLTAAKEGRLRCVDRLLKSEFEGDFDLNAADDRGDTALTLAAQNNHEEVVRMLLHFGANIFPRNRSDLTALDAASAGGHLGCVRGILCHMFDENARRIFSGRGLATYLYLAVMTAIETGQAEVVECFIQSGYNVNMNLHSYLGTALHCAVDADQLDLVQMLLSCGADVELLRRDQQQTPLMLAALSGRKDIVKCLLDAGAKINRQTDECSSALTLACHNGHHDVVKLLIANGADLNQMNRWGFNPVFMATDSPDILEMLLEVGADPNTACGERDECPLHLAAVVGNPEAVETLLRYGADINVLTNENENALWLATWKGHVSAAKLLIQQNIDLDVRTNACQVYHYNYTCLEVAIGQRHFEIAVMLLTAGCSLINPEYCSLDGPPTFSDLPWLRLRPEPLAVLLSSPENAEEVRQLLRNPGQLKHICRLMIRRCLRSGLLEALNLLSVPRPLRRYLMMMEL